jgi:phospholipase/lecithinase/hemolysin
MIKFPLPAFKIEGGVLVNRYCEIRLAIVLLLLFPFASLAMPFSNMIVIGDSLSDQGNVAVIIGGQIPPPEYTDGIVSGRFTNGLNYVDILAENLDLLVTPSVLGGNNFAYGGARTGSHPLAAFGALSVLEQRDAYLDHLAGSTADPNALHVLWAGSNKSARYHFRAVNKPRF